MCRYQDVCPHKDLCPGGREGCTEPCPCTRGTSRWPMQAGGHRSLVTRGVTSRCPSPLLLSGGVTFRRSMGVKSAEQESCAGTDCLVTEAVTTQTHVLICLEVSPTDSSRQLCVGTWPRLGETRLSTVRPLVFWNSLSRAHVTFTHTKRLMIKLFKNLKSMNSVIIIKCIEAPWRCTREAVLRGQRSPSSNIRLDSFPVLYSFVTFKVFFFFLH